MVWQVHGGHRLLLLALLSAVAFASDSLSKRAEEMLDLGTVSINSHGTFGKQSDQRLNRRHDSPALDKLMGVLGMRSEVTSNPRGEEDDEEEDLAPIKERRRMRTENLEDEDAGLAEEGQRLEDEYDERREDMFPIRDAERIRETDDALVGERSKQPRHHARSARRSHHNVLRKRTSRSESELDQADLQDYDSNDESNLELERGDGDHVIEDEPYEPDEKIMRRKDAREDERAEEVESGTKHIETISDGQSTETGSDSSPGYSLGESVRAYHSGTKVYEGAKVLATHEDGTITVNWDSGDVEHRIVNATDLYRPHQAGDDSPYRFEGPNAYNILQEQQHRVVVQPLTPSTKSIRKQIFDGYTLFPPSALDRKAAPMHPSSIVRSAGVLPSQLGSM